jgi:hypothetical protein
VKLAIIIALVLWLLCGIAGAWRLDELDRYHWEDIARGPITLAASLDEDPVTYPGP